MNKSSNAKLIILGPKNTNKIEVARSLIAANDNLEICPTFNSNIDFKGKMNDSFEYYMANNDVEMGFKNNAFIYVTTNSYASKGITISDYYNSDIIVMDFIDFNNISEATFKKIITNCIIVMLDTSKGHDKGDIQESFYSYQRLKSIDYLYFLNEETEYIKDTIFQFLKAYKDDDKDKMKELFELNM